MRINVGALDADGERFPTKTALKSALKAAPGSVEFDGTSPYAPDVYEGDSLPVGVSFDVVGPDPYTTRKWYATVVQTAKGLKVS